MMKAMLASWVMLGFMLLGGCGKTEDGPRYGGRIVSHVEAYGSGTGSESGELKVRGTVSEKNSGVGRSNLSVLGGKAAASGRIVRGPVIDY